MVNFGRYRGETYLHVLRQRTQYASWVVHQLESSPECSPALARLGRYLAANFVQAAMDDDQPAQEDIEIHNPDAPAEAEMGDGWRAWHQHTQPEQDEHRETEDSYNMLFSHRRR